MPSLSQSSFGSPVRFWTAPTATTGWAFGTGRVIAFRERLFAVVAPCRPDDRGAENRCEQYRKESHPRRSAADAQQAAQAIAMAGMKPTASSVIMAGSSQGRRIRWIRPAGP